MFLVLLNELSTLIGKGLCYVSWSSFNLSRCAGKASHLHICYIRVTFGLTGDCKMTVVSKNLPPLNSTHSLTYSLNKYWLQQM
jgi:hypothetical protein